MRVLYLADAPYIHTRRWVEHFAARGYDCEVISFRPGQIAGARVTYVDGFERLGKARYLLQARRLAAMVRERKPDLLHAHHLTSYGFLGALSGHHPFLLSVWGTDILEAPRWTPFHLWLTRYALRHADEITATGRLLAEATAKYAPPSKPVHVTPYGVDLSRFRPEVRTERPAVVVGTLARLSREKGVRYLVEAFARVRQRFGERVLLRIAGQGPERQALESLAARLGVPVEWQGWIEHAAVPAFLQSLDIFVLPSVHEGFGVAAVEASAMELPVVASGVDGIPDVVVDGETGVLAPPKDIVGLADAIAALVDDADGRRRLGEAGREFVAQNYDWEKNAALMERLYQQLAGQPAGAAP